MYTREQYEIDRKAAIERGVDPRLIMSYSACIAYDEWQLREKLYELEDEMEYDSVEDATAWEKWDEYESLLYKLAEYETAA